MKTFAVIILMFLFFSNSREFTELYKLPLLIKHYHQHKTPGSGLSFFAFLQQHYTRESQNDNDDSEDNGLPFKIMTENYVTIFYLPTCTGMTGINSIEHTSVFNSRYTGLKSLGLIFPFFHPPCC